MKIQTMQAVKVPTAWIMEAQTYREFDSFVEAYRGIGVKARFVEVGDMPYYAVFYTGKKPIEFIKQMDNKYTEEVEDIT